MVKRVFISQPMRDKSEAEIKEVREKCMDVARDILGADEEVIEIPKFDPMKLRGLRPARCLGMSIELMSDADLVIFAPGWQYARGCRIEHRVCKDYGIPYREIEE